MGILLMSQPRMDVEKLALPGNCADWITRRSQKPRQQSEWLVSGKANL